LDGELLKLNQIPRKEPKIRIGIILPRDILKTLQLSFSDPECYEIETSSKIFPSCTNKKKINIEANDNKIIIPQLSLNSNSIKFIPSIPDDNPFVKINKVPAGRGFHWEKKIDLSYWGTIELSCINNNIMVINELPLENYLKCVATSEMSAICPQEFLKAQFIIARSWLLANTERKHVHLSFDICNDDCCQRYQGILNTTKKSNEVSELTFGKVITYNNKIGDARYSKSCGGITENFENVWVGNKIPYLTSIEDKNSKGIPYCSTDILSESSLKTYIGNIDDDGEYYRWNYKINNKNLIHSLKNNFSLDVKKILELNPIKVGASGRIIKLEIVFLNIDDRTMNIEIISEYQIRKILSPSFLYSSAFTVNKIKDQFILEGKGWGHGVGLCQIGALGMALSNNKVMSILSHYYPGTEIETIYNK
jgi:SpoIID/LytB domain protein|tara:strand:- start:3821 stop:5086 length:1266 start_codon:yes stop_codon:yes gene_type:complete